MSKKKEDKPTAKKAPPKRRTRKQRQDAKKTIELKLEEKPKKVETSKKKEDKLDPEWLNNFWDMKGFRNVKAWRSYWKPRIKVYTEKEMRSMEKKVQRYKDLWAAHEELLKRVE